MFKKKRNKKRHRPTLMSVAASTKAEDDGSTNNAVSSSLLSAMRVEQGQRKKRRAVILAGVSAYDELSRTSSRKKCGAAHQLDGDEEKDEDLQAYIAERIDDLTSGASTAATTTTTANNNDDEGEAYEILRRKTKSLSAAAGGASDIAGSGIAGIGIFEVSLPESERIRNEKATKAALAAALSQSKTSRAYESELPTSFSGNFVRSGKLMHRQSAIRQADGHIAITGHAISSKDRPRDRESLRNFQNNERR